MVEKVNRLGEKFVRRKEMRGKKKVFFGLIALVLVALVVLPFCGACAPKPAAGPQTLKIGTVMPISGPLGTIGLAWDRGFDLGADWVNEQGGLKVGGDTYQIQFIHEDSKLSPEASTAAATKLVFQDNVKFVMGEILAPNSEAIYNVTKTAGVLHILTYTQDPYREDMWGVGADNPLVVLLMPTTNLAYKPFFDYLHANYPNVKKVVHAEVNMPFDRLIEEAKKTAEASGFNVVGVERYDYGWTDWYPFATNVLKYDPDAISVDHADPNTMYLIVKAAREQGFKGPIMSLGSASAVFVLAGAGADNCYDIMCDQAYGGDPNAPDMMKTVKARWEAKYTDPYVDDALMPWDEVWVLAQAIEKAKSLEPEAVVTTLEGMTKSGSLKTVFGPGHMGGLETLGVNRQLVRPIPITVIQGNEIKMAKWATPELP